MSTLQSQTPSSFLCCGSRTCRLGSLLNARQEHRHFELKPADGLVRAAGLRTPPQSDYARNHTDSPLLPGLFGHRDGDVEFHGHEWSMSALGTRVADFK